MTVLWTGLGVGAAFFGLFSGMGLHTYLRACAITKLTEAGYQVEGTL